MLLIYRLATAAYFAGIWLAAFFNEKAAKWVSGRRGWASKLKASRLSERPPGQTLVWVHCASLGEFEQGRTLIEGLKAARPDTLVLLSFFSPSGYEIRENYPFADLVCYLPADSPKNARRFLRLVRPDVAVFVKYEFWHFFLQALRRAAVPTYLVAASFRENQPFFRWYGAFHRAMLACFTRIFVQTAADASLLASIGMPADVAGDPRVDRVAAIAGNPMPLPHVADFCKNAPVLVAGSTWPADEALLWELMKSPAAAGWKFIVAPHDVSPARLADIERTAPMQVLRFSKLGQKQPAGLAPSLLLIDNIGLLSSLYQFGRLAYVGGGFGVSIHNVLEPAAFGLPVFFGPKFQKFPEAVWLVNNGGAFSVGGAAELLRLFEKLQEQECWDAAVGAAMRFFDLNKGATWKILDHLCPR